MKAFGIDRRLSVLCVLSLAISLTANGFAAAYCQETEPQVAEEKQVGDEAKQKPKRPPIYDESANAEEQIQAALTKAKSENRRVFVQWGANWCGWCHLLHEIMKTHPEIARKVMYEYDVVLVDVGRMDKNQELAAKYEADLEKNGLPFITILNADGNVLVNQETSSLEKEDKENPAHDPDAVLEFLTKHQAEPIDGRAELSDAMNRAATEEKLVFLHFGAPWCGWCHRMEAWMARPEIAQTLSKHFVCVKIDTDRMTHGSEILAEYCAEPGGIPWFVFIDPTSKEALVNSDGPKGNVGFPFEDFEIDHFCDMLTKCQGKFSPDDIDALRKSLVENRDAVKAKAAERAAQVAAEADANENDQ